MFIQGLLPSVPDREEKYVKRIGLQYETHYSSQYVFSMLKTPSHYSFGSNKLLNVCLVIFLFNASLLNVCIYLQFSVNYSLFFYQSVSQTKLLLSFRSVQQVFVFGAHTKHLFQDVIL